MHAVIVHVKINNPDEAVNYLRSDIVPRVSQAPGFVTGHWYGDGQTSGHATVIWESEDHANAFVEMLRSQEGPNHATIEDVEVHEVVANA